METTNLHKGDIWQQVIDCGVSRGMERLKSVFGKEDMIKHPDSPHAYMAVLDPSHALYMKRSFYDSAGLSWVNRLDDIQIITSTDDLYIVMKNRRSGFVMCVCHGGDDFPSDRLTCAWCSEELQIAHNVPFGTTCETFTRRKQALQDSRTMWLRWSQVARAWLSEDVTRYGGHLLVKLIRT